MAEESWGEFQHRRGAIVSQYSVDQVKDLIRRVTAAEEPFYTCHPCSPQVPLGLPGRLF